MTQRGEAPTAPHTGRSQLTELTCIVDPTSGALTVEGVDRSNWIALAGDLLPVPHEVNCARPLHMQQTQPRPPAGPGQNARAGGAGRSNLLRVARIYHGSVVDGPGRRSVVQVQGCPIRCAGCYVPQTHDPAGGAPLAVAAVLDALLAPEGRPRDGITVLGGEPFAQPVPLVALLRGAKARQLHTVVYSGYTVEALLGRPEPEVREALALTDLLIDGPFVAALADGAGEWRGSRNQRLLHRPLHHPLGHSLRRPPHGTDTAPAR